MASLFKSGLGLITCILLFAYLGNVGTYYYFVKWIPMIVTDLGYNSSEATNVLGVISLGGVIGSVGLSIIARFLPIRLLMALLSGVSGDRCGCISLLHRDLAKHETHRVCNRPVYLCGHLGLLRTLCGFLPFLTAGVRAPAWFWGLVAVAQCLGQ